MLRGCERLFVFIFLFEYEIGSGGSGGDFNPVGDAGGNVDDVSRVEGDLFSAFDAGAESFAGDGGAAVGSLLQHDAAVDEDEVATVDVDLIGPELMAFGVAGVGADDEEGLVVAVVFEPTYCEARGACFGGFDQLGFALLEIGGGMCDWLGGLGGEWGCDKRDGQEDAT